ncbi:16S rRNA (guanine(966)-N(2))-methyltransferase RsmD [Cryptosporangium phraense]|uniref:16S rRNA (Guanine(966)-N(2))-methyltransferase RsmD n=1 Tax=Cryptosporangium phraense TaxID=2593070 RepID=A0A545ASH0_9ACTN|nr:16S rRNA (guanine(966)-N(2))-methyltransferase RsmD [Cryptosporangium phraense]TQS44268.1 16S rRNA (guanine(966)-N(2))-methyltransferase RsmD [Cryptosporangium phraense]
MTRIVAGVAGGRRIDVPPGKGTRPTSDRAREALFSAVAAALELEGANVLDLYAGSGAVGFEALSRGAAHALLVDSDPKAVRTLRANAAALGLPGAEVRSGPVERLAGSPASRAYDLVFADPPYALAAAALASVLTDLDSSGWLGSDALVVVERSTRDEPWVWPKPLVGVRERRYGEGTLWYGRRS